MSGSIVSNEIFDTLEPHEAMILRAKFADPLLKKFLASQVEAAKREFVGLDPAKAKSPEDYFQSAKDARLVLQFWTDFLHFAEDWGKFPEALSRNGE